MPVVDSLTAIVEQTEDQRLAQVMAQVRRAVNEGSELHKALREHPVFPNLYCNMIAAGESSGTLELVSAPCELQRVGETSEPGTVCTYYPAIMISFAF